MEFLPVELRDPAVLRRLKFAAVFLPKELPDYWSVITRFIEQEAEIKESVRVAVENLDVLLSAALSTDSALASEMQTLCSEKPGSQPVGIILISSNLQCSKCGGELHVKNDRPSRVTIYTEPLGTVVGTHYHKVCQNFRKGCAFRQYYGYSSEGSQSITYYGMDSICYAKDADFVQFSRLPGQINTGCVASPAFKSHFCNKHDCSSLSSTNSVIKVCICKNQWQIKGGKGVEMHLPFTFLMHI